MLPVKDHRHSKWHNWDSECLPIHSTLCNPDPGFALWYPWASWILMACLTSSAIFWPPVLICASCPLWTPAFSYLPCLCLYLTLWIHLCLAFPVQASCPVCVILVSTVLEVTQQDLQIDLWHYNFCSQEHREHPLLVYWEKTWPEEMLAFLLYYLQNI